MNIIDTTINDRTFDHATMAPAADVLRYLLGRPATQVRVVQSIADRVALRRLRDSGLIFSCQSLVASLFKLSEDRSAWEPLAKAIRLDLDTDPDRATMGFADPDLTVCRVLLGFPGDMPDPLALLDK